MVKRPAQALGAPQTISFTPSMVSTRQTRRRSALGCWAASTTRATVNAASLAAGSATRSTSSPAMVMASTTSATPAAVSRCSFSQARVNFIARSLAQARRRIGRGEGGEAIVGQPADVGGEHVAQVRHAVLQPRQAIDAEAEGEALPFVGIDAAIAQYRRVDHAAADDLRPFVANADLHLAAGGVAPHVHLRRGFGEREVMGTKARHHAVELEEPGA